MMPFQKVNQTLLEAAYAVPTPSFPPCVHLGSMPGHPKAFIRLCLLVGFISGCFAAPSRLSAIYAAQLTEASGNLRCGRGLRIFRAAEHIKPTAFADGTECAMKG